MTNPFLKTGNANPLMKSVPAQKTGAEEQSGQNNKVAETSQSKELKPEQQDEQLKKYSQAWMSYGLAQIAMSSSGKVGTETCGTMG